IQPVTSLVAQAVPAVVEGTRVYGDAYLVTDGAKTYSVLDVYIRATQATDIVASVCGVSTYKASWVQNQGICFRHAGNSSWNPTYTDAAGASWDSFLTMGLRTQSNDGDGGTLIALTADPGFSNFNSVNPCRITGASTGNGPGWYPSVGAIAATNPYCVVGFYNGASNVAKTTCNIAANGINPGQSLDNHFMIARLSIDLADVAPGVTPTVTIKLCMTVLNTGASSSTGGGTNVAYRSTTTLEFATPNNCNPCAVGPTDTDCNSNGTADRCERNATTDTDNDGKLDSCERRGCDLDLNGVIDAGDIGALLTLWDQTPAWGDLDGDGRITGGDLAEILLKFGQSA
ncbi:MAG: hypothetical protein EBQ99_10860, partial [Planctomycetes bacterium]|nr:hypothetical protein [Planctomycetota bacterium]